MPFLYNHRETIILFYNKYTDYLHLHRSYKLPYMVIALMDDLLEVQIATVFYFLYLTIYRCLSLIYLTIYINLTYHYLYEFKICLSYIFHKINYNFSRYLLSFGFPIY